MLSHSGTEIFLLCQHWGSNASPPWSKASALQTELSRHPEGGNNTPLKAPHSLDLTISNENKSPNLKKFTTIHGQMGRFFFVHGGGVDPPMYKKNRPPPGSILDPAIRQRKGT